jgi:hypothetical protein
VTLQILFSGLDIMTWEIVLKDTKYNKHSGKVAVLLSWDVPFNHSAVSSYTIKLEGEDTPIIPRRTNKTEEWFEVDVNTVYRVEVCLHINLYINSPLLSL